MNLELTKRLSEIGITREGIIKLLEPKEEDDVVIYATCMDGLGTQGSDFDIYVVGKIVEDGQLVNDKHRIKLFDLNPQYYGMENVAYLYLDVEYWTPEMIDNIIDRIKNGKSVENEKLKLIYRLFRGEKLKYYNMEIEEKITLLEFQNYVKYRFALSSDCMLHDCIVLFNGKEYYGALLCGRLALNYAISGYNAKNGKINFNMEKWSYKLFFNTEHDEEMEKKYFRYMFGAAPEDMEGFLKELIVFVQDILNSELDFLGKKHWVNKEKYNMLDESQDVLYIL